MQGERTDPDPVAMLGKVHPIKSMGLDPLFGGDLRTLNPTLPRGHEGTYIGCVYSSRCISV